MYIYFRALYLPSKLFLVGMEIDGREEMDANKILFPLLNESLMLPIRAYLLKDTTIIEAHSLTKQKSPTITNRKTTMMNIMYRLVAYLCIIAE